MDFLQPEFGPKTMELITSCIETGKTKTGIKEYSRYAKVAAGNRHRINLTVYNRAKLMTTF
jgi:hypothetical protein